MFRSSTTICLIAVMTTVASARTAPRRGAASKPRSFEVRIPFPCGVKVRISCAYGPGCSRAHRRVKSKTSTNDYYALDLIRTGDPRNGFDLPVVAAAPGTVRYAGWTRRGWAPYGKIVYIDHPFQDRKGRRYQTLYAHLNRVLVKDGQRVEAGTPIGTLGGSSRRALNRFGPHLHFAVYRGAGRRLGGGRAVVPEPLGAWEDLRHGMSLRACGAPGPAPVASSDPHVPTAFGGLSPDPPAAAAGAAKSFPPQR